MNKTAIRKDKRTRLQRSFQQTVLKLYRKKNLDEITVNEVCDKIGVPRSSFYYHYATIRDVVEEAEKDMVEELAAAYSKIRDGQSDKKEKFLNVFNASLPFIKANEQFFRTVMIAHQDFFFLEKWSNAVENHLGFEAEKGFESKVLADTMVFSVGNMLAAGTTLAEEKGAIIYDGARSISPFKKRLLDL